MQWRCWHLCLLLTHVPSASSPTIVVCILIQAASQLHVQDLAQTNSRSSTLPGSRAPNSRMAGYPSPTHTVSVITTSMVALSGQSEIRTWNWGPSLESSPTSPLFRWKSADFLSSGVGIQWITSFLSASYDRYAPIHQQASARAQLQCHPYRRI